MAKGGEGHLHPITILTDEITRIFTELGFDVTDGPELVTEYENFDSLNFPKDHPARDMQDTFWIKPEAGDKAKLLLRTQTSAMQVPYMKNHVPPFRIITPGKVFRNEATDATHEMQFFQLEGMVVNKNTTVGDLKWTLEHFLEKLFGADVAIRLRPSFFPFVEPGYEVDMQCFKCKGVGLKPSITKDGSPDHSEGNGLGCSTCKQSGWIEILGAGMIHPNVLRAAGIDPRQWQGFAFGCGLDRIALLKWGIDDLRLLYNGDLRVVSQF